MHDIAQGGKVTWQALWRHMAQDCQVAIILRLALDDANAGVVAAAAAAMHALLGGGRTSSEPGFLDTGTCAIANVDMALPACHRTYSRSIWKRDTRGCPCAEASMIRAQESLDTAILFCPVC